MEFNKRKFNIFVMFTVCLICFVIVFSSVTISAVSENENIENTLADSEEEIINEEETKETEETTTTETTVTTAPTFSTNQKWLCLNYALNNLSKNNYRMNWHQGVKNIIGTQIVDKYIYVTSGKSYAKTVASGQENFTEYGYVEAETSVITKRDNSGNKVYKYSDYMSKYAVCINELVYDLSQATCDITSFTSSPLSNYYMLEITLKADAYADYRKTMIATAGYIPNFSSVTLIMKIDKKYGRITFIKSIENYKILVSNCISTVTMTFSYKDYSNSESVAEIKSALGI